MKHVKYTYEVRYSVLYFNRIKQNKGLISREIKDISLKIRNSTEFLVDVYIMCPSRFGAPFRDVYSL